MITPLDIIFQNGDFYNEPGGFLTDTFIPLLGVIATLVVVWLTYRVEKKRDRENLQRIRQDQIRYLQARILGVIPNITNQVEAYKELSDEITKNAFNLPLLRKHVQANLEDLINRIDQEEYFHAYSNEFGASEIITKEYFNIFSLLNYYYSNFILLENSFEKSNSFDHERQTKCREIIEPAMDDLIKLIGRPEIKIAFAEVCNRVYNLIQPFYDNRPKNAGIEYYINKFIGPARDIIYEASKQNRDLEDMLFRLRDGIIKANDIARYNQTVGGDFMESYTVLHGRIQELQNLSLRLLNHRIP